MQGTAIRLTMEDDGRGIAESAASQLFHPPFATARNRGNTGLGLTIARAQLAAHDGSLTYAPRDGKTVFDVRVPRASG